MNAFYNNLFDGKFSLIDWEKDLVYSIAKMLDPNAKRFASMADVWADPTRRAMHVTYVGRLLDCIGKRQGAPLSLSSIVGEWEPVLAKAQTRGAGMTQDALREIKSLMEAVWRNAESVICASYTTGAPWINGLIEPDLSALMNFRSWCDDLAEVARMSKKFRGTFAVRTATHRTPLRPAGRRARQRRAGRRLRAEGWARAAGHGRRDLPTLQRSARMHDELRVSCTAWHSQLHHSAGAKAHDRAPVGPRMVLWACGAPRPGGGTRQQRAALLSPRFRGLK